jgi:hypothetical protein
VAVLPTCLALVLCDRVDRTAGSGKASSIGIFHSFDLQRLPGSTKPFSVWVQATNAVGQVLMQLVFERALSKVPEFEEVVTVRFTVFFENSTAFVEHHARFENGIELPVEGNYRVRLDCAGSTILARYFVAKRE